VSSGTCAQCKLPGTPGNPTHKKLRAAYIAKKCAHCGNEMPYEQRKLEFCSKRCANTFMWLKRDGKACRKNCGECGAEFLAKTAEKYCTAECKRKARLRHQEVPERHFKRLISLRLPGRMARSYHSELTAEDLMELYRKQEGKCAISGELMTFRVGKGRTLTNCSLDRIDPMGVYTKDNVQLVCHVVNIMKHNLSEQDFTFWCKLIAKNQP